VQWSVQFAAMPLPSRPKARVHTQVQSLKVAKTAHEVHTVHADKLSLLGGCQRVINKGYKVGGDTPLPAAVTLRPRVVGFCRRPNAQTCIARPHEHVGALQSVLDGSLTIMMSPEDGHCLLLFA
jgi:hypothetical protein